MCYDYRYGIVAAIKTKRYIKKDEELFADYGYNFHTSPIWYRYLFRQYVKEKPTKMNLMRLDDELNKAEKNEVNELSSTIENF